MTSNSARPKPLSVPNASSFDDTIDYPLATHGSLPRVVALTLARGSVNMFANNHEFVQSRGNALENTEAGLKEYVADVYRYARLKGFNKEEANSIIEVFKQKRLKELADLDAAALTQSSITNPDSEGNKKRQRAASPKRPIFTMNWDANMDNGSVVRAESSTAGTSSPLPNNLDGRSQRGPDNKRRCTPSAIRFSSGSIESAPRSSPPGAIDPAPPKTKAEVRAERRARRRERRRQKKKPIRTRTSQSPDSMTEEWDEIFEIAARLDPVVTPRSSCTNATVQRSLLPWMVPTSCGSNKPIQTVTPATSSNHKEASHTALSLDHRATLQTINLNPSSSPSQMTQMMTPTPSLNRNQTLQTTTKSSSTHDQIEQPRISAKPSYQSESVQTTRQIRPSYQNRAMQTMTQPMLNLVPAQWLLPGHGSDDAGSQTSTSIKSFNPSLSKKRRTPFMIDTTHDVRMRSASTSGKLKQTRPSMSMPQSASRLGTDRLRQPSWDEDDGYIIADPHADSDSSVEEIVSRRLPQKQPSLKAEKPLPVKHRSQPTTQARGQLNLIPSTYPDEPIVISDSDESLNEGAENHCQQSTQTTASQNQSDDRRVNVYEIDRVQDLVDSQLQSEMNSASYRNLNIANQHRSSIPRKFGLRAASPPRFHSLRAHPKNATTQCEPSVAKYSSARSTNQPQANTAGPLVVNTTTQPDANALRQTGADMATQRKTGGAKSVEADAARLRMTHLAKRYESNARQRETYVLAQHDTENPAVSCTTLEEIGTNVVDRTIVAPSSQS